MYTGIHVPVWACLSACAWVVKSWRSGLMVNLASKDLLTWVNSPNTWLFLSIIILASNISRLEDWLQRQASWLRPQSSECVLSFLQPFCTPCSFWWNLASCSQPLKRGWYPECVKKGKSYSPVLLTRLLTAQWIGSLGKSDSSRISSKKSGPHWRVS